MKKEKTLGIIALALAGLAVLGFILTIWLFTGKEAGIIISCSGCVLIMLASVLLYVIALLRDTEDDFGCVFFPFFLAALASAVFFATDSAVANAIALGAMAAFLTAAILQVFGKRLIIVSVLVGALVMVLDLVGMGSFATFFLMIVALAAVVICIICYKKNDDMAFWGIVAGAVTFGVLLAASINEEFAQYGFILNMCFMSTILCGISAVPEAKEEEKAQVLEANGEGVATVDRALVNETEETASEADPAAETAPESEVTKSAPASETAPAPYAKWVLKRFSNLTAKELMDAPVYALKGVSEDDADLLKSAFGIKTIGDLATNKFFKIADEVFEDTLNK